MDFDVLTETGAAARPDRGRRRLRRRRARAAAAGGRAPTRSASTSTSSAPAQPIPDGRYLRGRRRGAAARGRLGRRRGADAQPAPRPDPDAAFPELRRVVRDLVYVAEPLPTGELLRADAAGRRRDRGARGRAGGDRPRRRLRADQQRRVRRGDPARRVRGLPRHACSPPTPTGPSASPRSRTSCARRSGPATTTPPMRADLLRVVSSGAVIRELRDLLLEHREDYDAARAAFAWPQLGEFNWALDWFDPLARGNDADRAAGRGGGRLRAAS